MMGKYTGIRYFRSLSWIPTERVMFSMELSLLLIWKGEHQKMQRRSQVRYRL